MGTSLAEFEARLSEIERQLDFVASASRLRPRLGGVVRWDAAGEETELAKQFMSQKEAHSDGLYASLLVRVLAALERLARRCIGESVDRQVAAAERYEAVAPTLQQRHLVLSGRLLSQLDSPSDNISFSATELLARLAECRDGATNVTFNTVAFEALVTGASPPVLEKAFQQIGRENWWDAVGADKAVERALEAEGAGPRETGKRARERLRDLWKWRNGIAHAGDGEVTISESECRQHVAFVRAFGRALERVANT